MKATVTPSMSVVIVASGPEGVAIYRTSDVTREETRDPHDLLGPRTITWTARGVTELDRQGSPRDIGVIADSEVGVALAATKMFDRLTAGTGEIRAELRKAKIQARAGLWQKRKAWIEGYRAARPHADPQVTPYDAALEEDE